MFAKQGRYFFDSDAVRQPLSGSTEAAMARGGSPSHFRVNHKHYAAGIKHSNDGMPSHSGAMLGNPAGANLRNYWLLGPEPSREEHYACVDAATECLTLEGWKRHDELREREMVASYSVETGRLRWAPLVAVSRYDVAGDPLVYVQAPSVDMALTPNHRVVYQRRRLAGGFGESRVKRADEIRKDDAIPTTAEWEEWGEDFDPIWAELLGWYVAEGYEMKNSMTVEISQSLDANAPKVERLRELLLAVEANFSEATGRRTWRGRDVVQTYFKVRGYVAARLRELAPGKQFDPSVLAWSPRALRALMAGLIEGDGHTRKDDGRMSFIQKNQRTADLVHAIAVRLGWSAKLSQKAGGTWTLYLTRHNRRSLRGTAGAGAVIERRPYTGIVWCPTTADGAWVARRNGTVWITGNSFPSEIPRRCILAGSRPGDTVLDPFLGSGTTALVADRLGRDAIGIELNPRYVEIARRRIESDERLFSEPVQVQPAERQATLFEELGA